MPQLVALENFVGAGKLLLGDDCELPPACSGEGETDINDRSLRTTRVDLSHTRGSDIFLGCRSRED